MSLRYGMFSELITAERSLVFSANGFQSPSVIRDVITTTGSGSVTQVGGEIVVSSGGTAGSTARIDTAEYGEYHSGYGAEMGIGIRISDLPQGDTVARWGMGDGVNGLYFEQRADSLLAARLKNGVATTFAQENWNIDAAPKVGIGAQEFDVRDGHIFQIPFAYYGDGPVVWGIAAVRGNNQEFMPLHIQKFEGELSIANPNLPIFAEVINGAGDATDYKLYVHGRQYSIIGKTITRHRYTSQYRAVRTGIGATPVPLVSFRVKDGWEAYKTLLDSYNTKVASADVIIEAVLGGTLTGASWQTPDRKSADETAVEVDVSATAITGGEPIWSQMEESGTGNKERVLAGQLDVVFPPNQIISLTALVPAGATTADVTMLAKVRENW